MHKATQAWQKSKGHPPTDKLPDDQKVELVAEALKERDEVGWSVLHDKPSASPSVCPPSW